MVLLRFSLARANPEGCRFVRVVYFHSDVHHHVARNLDLDFAASRRVCLDNCVRSAIGYVQNGILRGRPRRSLWRICLLYTSDAADDLLCVDFGGSRIIKNKKLLTSYFVKS